MRWLYNGEHFFIIGVMEVRWHRYRQKCLEKDLLNGDILICVEFGLKFNKSCRFFCDTHHKMLYFKLSKDKG